MQVKIRIILSITKILKCSLKKSSLEHASGSGNSSRLRLTYDTDAIVETVCVNWIFLFETFSGNLFSFKIVQQAV